MPRTTLAALALFVANTLIAAAFLWEARPRTVWTMDPETLLQSERAAVNQLIKEDGVSPDRVRVCEEAPCTRGPAVFVQDGRVRRLELPRSSRPGPLTGSTR